MRRVIPVFAVVALLGASDSQQAAPMTFFITSTGAGAGAKLGGLEGADRHCQTLADAAGSRGLQWHAYLSAIAKDGKPAVHAKDRIGRGPWHNVKGVQVAASVADLHSDNNKLGKENSLTEKGGGVNGRGDTPNTHDILTGSNLDGTAFTAEGYSNCDNWTSDGAGATRVGHHDKMGGGENPNSWNSAHSSRGCSLQNLQASGGAGLFYCFGFAR
ncbi:MAG TPA: hypothetical protein VJR92_10480 [Gemmatimonadaceae bacterium]|nr:hypothetical protein [Gemmatimonadaceae bacterium]